MNKYEQENMNYPLFLPPDQVAKSSPLDWSLSDRELYFRWLVSNVEARTDCLLDYCGHTRNLSNVDLIVVGESSVSLMNENLISDDDHPSGRLNDSGLAIAADLGLLVARMLLNDRPETLHWEILKTNRKELATNRPVIKGFTSGYLEPIGGSIAEAKAVIRGKRDAGIWQEIRDFWLRKATVAV